MTASAQKARHAAERVVAVCDVLASLIPSDLDTCAADVRTPLPVDGSKRTGEAVNRIPDEVLTLFSEQPWRQIVAQGAPAALAD